MSDFNPVTLYFILYEGMGAWLWALLALGLLLVAGIVFGVVRLRRARRPAKRPLMMAFAVGLAATIVFTFLVPVWTLAGPGALGTPVDYAASFLLALVPGATFGATAFFLAAMRCAAMARRGAVSPAA